MLFHVPDEIRHAVALVIARTLVMDIAKSALNRVRLRAGGGEEEQLEARVLSEPPLDGLGLVNALGVHHHIDFGKSRFRVVLLQAVEPGPEPDIRLTDPETMAYPSGLGL